MTCSLVQLHKHLQGTHYMKESALLVLTIFLSPGHGAVLEPSGVRLLWRDALFLPCTMRRNPQAYLPLLWEAPPFLHCSLFSC